MSDIDGGLRALFKTHLRAGFDWQSIETGMTGRGVPDSNYCSLGVEGWVEFKQTDGWAVTLRPEQVGWHMRRARAGGRTFIAVRQTCGGNTRRAACDCLWLFRGRFAPDLLTGGLKNPPSGSLSGAWPGGPEAWDWGAVRVALTT